MELPQRQNRSAIPAESRTAPSIHLYGRGFGGQPIYARAAVLQEDTHGRPTLSPELLTLTLHRRRHGEEDLDIVVVAGEGTTALLLPLIPGLHLVGMVSEQDIPSNAVSSQLSLAIVAGVTDARERINEGDLLIVDPEAGRVLVEPDAEEFVRLQAERGHRPRLLLGPSHVPAKTQAGRIVAVWAEVSSFADVADAVDAGADGLMIAEGGELLPGDGSDILPGLIEVAERFGGGDIALSISLEEIDPVDIVQFATRAVVRWALPDAGTLPFPLSELRNELARACAELEETRTPAGLPLLTGYFTEAFPSEGADNGWDEILLDDTVAAHLGIADTFALPPLRIRLTGEPSQRAHAASLPAISLIVSVDQVEETKDFIREQEY